MSDSDLVDYIQEQTQQGVSARDLRILLMEAGWHESDINNALHDIAAGLYPATPGASIHEDLAQVRTVVAHLATRIHSIEATLVSTGVMPVQGQLPSGTLGPDHEISAPQAHHRFGRAAMLVVLIALFGYLGSFSTALVARHSLSPVDQLTIAAATAALLLVWAIVAMRRRSVWTAMLLTASAVTLSAMVGLISWRVYNYMEWTTAAALGALLFVFALVAGVWIQRYSR